MFERTSRETLAFRVWDTSYSFCRLVRHPGVGGGIFCSTERRKLSVPPRNSKVAWQRATSQTLLCASVVKGLLSQSRLQALRATHFLHPEWGWPSGLVSLGPSVSIRPRYSRRGPREGHLIGLSPDSFWESTGVCLQGVLCPFPVLYRFVGCVFFVNPGILFCAGIVGGFLPNFLSHTSRWRTPLSPRSSVSRVLNYWPSCCRKPREAAHSKAAPYPPPLFVEFFFLFLFDFIG